MNIFVTDESPFKSAIVLPDRHVVKMPVETCQLLAIVASKKWGHDYGTLPKADGTSYATEKGAFRNHPCTKWAMSTIHNAYWLIDHGIHLCDEFKNRYGKIHSCYHTLCTAYKIFPKGEISEVTSFIRAMPDELKLNHNIDTFTAYKRYIASKPWVAENYLRIPSRKPNWI